MDQNLRKNVISFLSETVNLENFDHDFIIKINELFSSVSNRLGDETTKWLEENSIKEKFEIINKSPSEQEKIRISFELTQDYFLNETRKNLIMTIIKIFLNNFEDIILSIPILDRDLFSSFKKYISYIYVKFPKKTENILNSFWEEFFNPRNALTNFSTILQNFWNPSFVNPVDFNNLEKEKFYSIVSIWLLKFAQIIENPIKRMLFFFKKLKFINKKKTIRNLQIRNESVGSLLNEFQLPPELAKYRNAIFHQDLEIELFENKGESKIILKNRDFSTILGIKDYLNEFIKLIVLLLTFYSVCLIVYIKFKGNLKILNDFKKKLMEIVEEGIDQLVNNPEEIINFKNFNFLALKDGE